MSCTLLCKSYGHGCHKCKSHGFNTGEKGYLYLDSITLEKKSALKFGISNRKEDRIKDFKQKVPQAEVTELCYFSGDGTEIYNAEQYIKEKFKKRKGVIYLKKNSQMVFQKQ